MRRPSLLEIAGQIVLIAIFVALVGDLFSALDALACGHPDAGHDCYPWGTESAGDFWYYRSKELYLGTALIQLIGLLLAVLAPFWTTTPRSGLPAMIVMAASGPALIQITGAFF